MGVVVVSTVVFILSTMPELTDDIDLILDFNFNKSSKAVSPDNPAVERWEDVSFFLAFGSSCISLFQQHQIMKFYTLLLHLKAKDEKC